LERLPFGRTTLAVSWFGVNHREVTSKVKSSTRGMFLVWRPRVALGKRAAARDWHRKLGTKRL
jgi:hypothetical protein